MNAVTRTLFIAVLSNIILLFVNVQPLVSGDCSDGLNREVVQLYRLEHGRTVTIDYVPGVTVTLAGDSEGSAKLVGQSVVSVGFEPSGKGLGYGVEPQSLAAQRVETLLVPGSNSIKLVAVNPADHAWLTVRMPCPSLPDATHVLATTPTPASAIEDAIVAQVPTLTHTDEMVNAGNADASVGDSATASAGEALMQRVGRILLATALLGLILLFTMSDLYRLRHELLRLVEWCKRQEWSAMLNRVMAMDGAQFAAWRKRQELRLRGKLSAVKAELLERYHDLDWNGLVTRWHALKAQLLAWLKRLG